ncbi:MAG: long-chain fatty acid--CoA ligase [Chloroflexi bacterium]|nr:long-chain fatty acid--CoA ligase [Chloroflexota bacterium]MDK1045396.1 long-chain fatty acid--CoA ligase [Anaerolineales bacterium]
MDKRVWHQHYDEGVPSEIKVPEIRLHDFLEQSARDFPDRPCTIFKGAEISYREMNELTDRLAAGLVELGVMKGDRVAIFMPNSPQFVIAFYGILKAGGVVVATNPLYTHREIKHQMKDSGAQIMLAMSNFYNTVKEVQSETDLKRLIVTNIKEYLPPHLRVLFSLLKERSGGHRVTLAAGDEWLQEVLDAYTREDRPQLDIDPDDTALFQYTGGTTGLSKGAVGLHRNLVANTLQGAAWLTPVQGAPGEGVTLMAIPMFHVYGLIVGMTVAVQSGSAMVMIPNPRDLKDVLTSIDKYKPNIYPGVPAMYNAINNHPDVLAGKYDLSSIKACISGSAPLLRETKMKFEELTGGKLVEGFGLTESLVATHSNPIMGENRIGSIGLPFPNVDSRIVSLDDEVTVLEPDEVGELVIQSPSIMKGYHDMPTETANTLRDGWLYTGDIAYMDEDGYFYIVDRKKEMIKPSGFQVWPREVEEVIAENPKVLEVGVAGVTDDYRGETVKAWVVLKPGETATVDELRDWCRDRLAAFKVPTQVEFREELPKTTVGKILRRELVRQHKERVEAESVAD